MATSTYKCPNCTGGLLFDPDAQNFHCEYCGSRFTEEQMRQMSTADAKDQTAPQTDEQAQGAADEEPLMLYSCPSCGAQITADKTTAATFCYYCHNPVVLTGQLDGAYRPTKVIPFKIGKEAAVEAFLNWTKKKWFIPKNFFSSKQIETITGVYFPYWLVDCDMHGELHARATRVRVWRSGKTEYTETSHFQIVRRGKIHLEDVTKNALSKETSRLSAGVQPFDSKDVIDYVPAYLSGFMAEKRDIEREQCEAAVMSEIKSHGAQLLRGTIQGYTTVSSGDFTPHDLRSHWDYALLPVWTLTYKGDDGNTYFYTMNGQTGKTTGVLPLDKGKLTRVMAAVSGAVALLVFLAGGGLL